MTQWLSGLRWQSGSTSVVNIVEPISVMSFAGDGVTPAITQHFDKIAGYLSAGARYIETSTRRYDSRLWSKLQYARHRARAAPTVHESSRAEGWLQQQRYHGDPVQLEDLTN